MKKIVLLIAFATFGAMTTQAQRICFVDVNTILESVPEYKTAQTEVDRASEQWKQEIARERTEVSEMYTKYQAEEVLLSDNARKQRQDEISNKEKAMMDKQKAKFGPEGELFKKRQSLVKPIQDKVYKAIQAYAVEKGFDFILDKSSSMMLFAADTFDKTQDIIKRLSGN